jgi:hypothetical protein
MRGAIMRRCSDQLDEDFDIRDCVTTYSYLSRTLNLWRQIPHPANADIRRKRASDRDYADAAQTTNIERNIGAVKV